MKVLMEACMIYFGRFVRLLEANGTFFLQPLQSYDYLLVIPEGVVC